MTSGKYVLLHVVHYSGNRDYGFNPVFAVLDWQHDHLPPADDVLEFPLKRIDDFSRGPNWPFMIESSGRRNTSCPPTASCG